MDEPIRLHIVSPEREVVDAKVSSVTLPGVVSPFQVLRGHAPLLTALTPGVIRYTSQGKEHSVTVSSGFVEVRDNEVRVAAEL